MILVFECIILIALLVCYFNAPESLSAQYISIVIGLVAVSYIMLFFDRKTSNLFKNHFISNTNLFLLLFSVVCFQFPIDYLLGNDSISFQHYFYSFSTINLSTTFNAICFVSFILGTISWTKNKSFSLQQVNINKVPRTMPTKFILFIMYFLWIGYILFLNSDYIHGGHGTVLINSISVALYNYYWRINIIYLAISIFNASSRERLTIKEAINYHPKLYYCTVLISVALFFMANNRVYVFYLVTPLLFYFLSVLRLKTKPMISLILIAAAGVFFTLFKLFGISSMFSDGTINVSEMTNYDRLSSFSPFTSELAGSILADSALFYLWYSKGVVILGSTIVLGMLRSFSGLVPLFFLLTGLSVSTYESASYVTTALGANYGLGSSVSGDLIVSLGFVGAAVVMFLFGRICIKGDYNLFYNRVGFKGILLGMCVSSQIIFLVRASLADTIATILFCFVFWGIYIRFANGKLAKQ